MKDLNNISLLLIIKILNIYLIINDCSSVRYLIEKIIECINLES